MQNLAHTGGNSSSSRQPTRVENLLQGYPQLDVPPPPHADADNALYKLLVQNRHVMQRTADVFKKKARAKKTRMNTPEDDAAFAKLVRMECTDEGKEDIALAGEEFPTELLRKSKSSTSNVTRKSSHQYLRCLFVQSATTLLVENLFD